MKCPVCTTRKLEKTELERNLKADTCAKCGGHWLSSGNYAIWLKQHGPTLPEKPFSEVSFDIKDSEKAKICPQCGSILLKYKVGHGLDFYLDHCVGCGGVWLDRNEWEALKDRNLHDEIHRIFSTAWQKKIRMEKMHEELDNMYRHRFGDEEYNKIKEMREWIHTHPQKLAILSFLRDGDPYSI